MTTIVWKVPHAFGANLVRRVRKITAVLGGIGMNAQNNAPGSKKSRLRATKCSTKQFVNKTKTLPKWEEVTKCGKVHKSQ